VSIVVITYFYEKSGKQPFDCAQDEERLENPGIHSKISVHQRLTKIKTAFRHGIARIYTVFILRLRSEPALRNSKG